MSKAYIRENFVDEKGKLGTAEEIGSEQPKITATGMLKGDGNGGVSAAVAGTDYDTASNIVSATAAMTPEQAAQTRQNIGADTPETVTEWLNEHVDPDTGYVIDDTLTIQGAAADAKATGDAVGELKSAISNELTQATTTANTYVNYPFAFVSGHRYVFYNLSSTATMTAYSRSTVNVDSFGSIGPNMSAEITATGDAEYVRVNSTKANETFKVVDLSSIDEEISALKSGKLDSDIYAHTVSGACPVSGTFYNFPYEIKSGRTYICSATTEGDTISIRTRETESGSNIDSCGPIAYGAPKSFVASADAHFARVSAYLSNGSFLIVEDGTINERLNKLEPKTPILNLPEKLYAVSGKELNIYFDNICENSEAYRFDIICSKGKQMERGYQITPVDEDAGTYTLKIDAYLDEDVIASAESTLNIKSSSAGSGDNVSFILMGDSTVNGTDTQIVADFTGDSMIVTSKGTRGTSPANHEGRTGWTFQYYYNSAEIGGISNPFRNPTSGVFDASYYFTNTGISVPDWFFIQLGINDVFLLSSDDEVLSKVKTCTAQCNAMIESLKNAVPNIKIGIAITIPPNRSQDAFGKAYGCGQNRRRYKRNNLIFVRGIISAYDNRESEGIYLVPIFTNLDTTYNMGLESIPVNARNTAITYESPIANGGVHPAESGYKQLADVYMAFLKAQVSV